ncbi:DinB family protein [Alicyclobacillus fastidiosus]|uniref:DinB family protein n=1 Tax=Alicyclobacillus fastidiosus TaxID=392011 RepID=A0ABY6ZNA3_9BACL|nr:DinB family protein [Alicyclobacillus fastidiosus]WAH44058.1 DinB family protein [Alicyclobacillus fastidiosus]GMA60345.1 hypothetical protein GCM10025859_07850 [Alicyclobacillus fastidiosus]
MLKEVSDHFEVLSMIHGSIDKMLDGLTEQQWLQRPNDGFNNIASIIDHITRVEKKFFSAVAGQSLELDTQAPFKAGQWDVSAIQQEWAAILRFSRDVLEGLSQEDLDSPGLSLRVGDLNKRQLIVYAIGHTTHHRGQIPLVLKMI